MPRLILSISINMPVSSRSKDIERNVVLRTEYFGQYTPTHISTFYDRDMRSAGGCVAMENFRHKYESGHKNVSQFK